MKDNKTIFSLIMATEGKRPAEFIRFWDSVKLSGMLFELLIIDQTGELRNTVNRYIDPRIRYYDVDFKGLSRARNYGISKAEGNILCFPDDDCWFSENLLEIVSLNFNDSHIDGVIGRIYDPVKNCEVNGHWPKDSFEYDRSKIFIGSSITMFFCRSVIMDSGGFNEKFGIGATYGACEETELLLRLIKMGKKIIYRNDILLYHPYFNVSYNPVRSYTYGMGFGAFVKKSISELWIFEVILFFLKKILSSIIKASLYSIVNRNKSEYYYSHLKGLLTGFNSYKPYDLFK